MSGYFNYRKIYAHPAENGEEDMEISVTPPEEELWTENPPPPPASPPPPPPPPLPPPPFPVLPPFFPAIPDNIFIPPFDFANLFSQFPPPWLLPPPFFPPFGLLPIPPPNLVDENANTVKEELTDVVVQQKLQPECSAYPPIPIDDSSINNHEDLLSKPSQFLVEDPPPVQNAQTLEPFTEKRSDFEIGACCNEYYKFGLPRDLYRKLALKLDGPSSTHLESLAFSMDDSGSAVVSFTWNNGQLFSYSTSKSEQVMKKCPNCIFGSLTDLSSKYDDVERLASSYTSSLFDFLHRQLIKLPRGVRIQKITIDNSFDSQLEIALLKVFRPQKWTAFEVCNRRIIQIQRHKIYIQFEYNINQELCCEQHLYCLINALRVTNFSVHISHGTPSYKSSEGRRSRGKGASRREKAAPERESCQNHLLVSRFGSVALVGELRRTLLAGPLSAQTQLMTQMVQAGLWGRSILRTMHNVCEFLKIAFCAVTSERSTLQSFRITAAGRDGGCNSDEARHKELDDQENPFDPRMMLCIVPGLQTNCAYRISHALVQQQVPLDDAVFLALMRRCSTFQCAFQTNVTPTAISKLDWQNGERSLNQVRITVREDFGKILEKFDWKHEDYKWMKLQRVRGNKATLYMLRPCVHLPNYVYIKVKPSIS